MVYFSFRNRYKYSMNTMFFENAAAAILQHLDKEQDINESASVGPYYYNENYQPTQLQEAAAFQNLQTNAEMYEGDGALLCKHVELAAYQILEAFVASKPQVRAEELAYITDQCLLAAISRKTTQLHSLLKSAYNKDIAKEHIEQAIRRQIKFLAYYK